MKIYIGEITPESNHILNVYIQSFIPDAEIIGLEESGLKGKVKRALTAPDTGFVIIGESQYQKAATASSVAEVMDNAGNKLHRFLDDQTFKEFMIERFGRLDGALDEDTVIPPDQLMASQQTSQQDDVFQPEYIPEASEVLPEQEESLVVASEDSGDKNEYERIIEDLKDKLSQSEMLVKSLTRQLEEEGLDEDIKVYTLQIEKLEKKIQQRDDELATADRTITEQRVKLEGVNDALSQVGNLKSEIERLREEKADVVHERDKFRNEVGLLNAAVSNLKNEIAEIGVATADAERDKEAIISYESDIRDLQGKISSLEDESASKDLEIQSLNEMLQNVEEERSAESKNLSEKIENLESELTSERQKAIDLETSSEKQVNEFSSKIENLESELKIERQKVVDLEASGGAQAEELANELNIEREQRRNTESELELERKRIEELEETGGTVAKSLRSELELERSKIEELQSALELERTKVSNLEESGDALSKSLSDELNLERERVKNLEAELDAEKQKLSDAEESNKASLVSVQNELDEALKLAEDSDTALSQVNAELESEKKLCAEKDEQISTLTQNLDTSQSKIDSLNSDLKSANQEIESLKSDLESSQSELSRLNGDLQSKDVALQNANSNIEQLNSRIAVFESEVGQLNSELDISKKNTDEADKLRSELTARNTELGDLQESFSKLTEESDNFKLELDERDTKISELQDEISKLSNEVENMGSLQDELDARNSELTELQGKVNELNESLKEINELKEVLANKNVELDNLHNEVGELSTKADEADKLATELKSKNAELDNLQDEITDLTSKANEADKLAIELKSKNVELDNLQDEITDLTNKANEVDSLNESLSSLRTELETLTSEKSDEITKLNEELSNKSSELDSVSQELSKVTEYNKELKSQIVTLTQSIGVVAESDDKVLELEKKLEEERMNVAKLESELEVLKSNSAESKEAELREELVKLKAELEEAKSKSSDDVDVLRGELEEERKLRVDLELRLEEEQEVVSDVRNSIFGKMAETVAPKAVIRGLNILGSNASFPGFICIAAGSSESSPLLYNMLRRTCMVRKDKRFLILDLVTDSAIDANFSMSAVRFPDKWLNGIAQFQDFLTATKMENVRIISTAFGYLNDISLLDVNWSSRLNELRGFADYIIINVGSMSGVVAKVLFNSFSTVMKSLIITKSTPVNIRTTMLNLAGLRLKLSDVQDSPRDMLIECVNFDEKTSRAMYQKLANEYKSRVLKDSDILDLG